MKSTSRGTSEGHERGARAEGTGGRTGDGVRGGVILGAKGGKWRRWLARFNLLKEGALCVLRAMAARLRGGALRGYKEQFLVTLVTAPFAQSGLKLVFYM